MDEQEVRLVRKRHRNRLRILRDRVRKRDLPGGMGRIEEIAVRCLCFRDTIFPLVIIRIDEADGAALRVREDSGRGVKADTGCIGSILACRLTVFLDGESRALRKTVGRHGSRIIRVAFRFGGCFHDRQIDAFRVPHGRGSRRHVFLIVIRDRAVHIHRKRPDQCVLLV